MPERYFVCVAGNIGSGKTTVADIIESVFNFKKHEEAVESNPYLPLFYEDMKKWAYNIQRYFLMTRFIAHENISLAKHSSVQDRSIYEDMEIFAPLHMKLGNFTEDQAKRYKMFCKLIYDEITPPDLVVYMRASIPVLKERIKKRNRDYEKELADPENDYLHKLQLLYEKWIKNYNLGAKIIIETDNLNFVENPDHVKLLINQIKSALMRKEEKLDNFFK